MPKLISIFLILLISIMQGLAQPAGDSEAEPLAWNEFYKLQWYDFQGKPGEDARGDAGASVQIKAKPFFIKNKIRYDVVAIFSRKKSWARDQTPDLLAHEQLHFDIAELYARKIRQKIRTLRDQGVNDVKTFNAEIQELLEESNRADIRYDIETLHGALAKKQEMWSQKVADDLAKLRAYRKVTRVIGG